MIYSIYCLKDQLTGFLSPSFDQNDAAAIRNFSFALQRGDLLFGSFPQHYDLYKLGSFSTETGLIVPCDLQVVCTGSSLITQKVGVDGD